MLYLKLNIFSINVPRRGGDHEFRFLKVKESKIVKQKQREKKSYKLCMLVKILSVHIYIMCIDMYFQIFLLKPPPLFENFYIHSC